MSASIARITIYPIKSLEGIQVDTCKISHGGSLENDRRYALFDSENKYVNTKRFPELLKIRCSYNLEKRLFILDPGNEYQREFNLNSELIEIDKVLSEKLNFKVTIKENTHIGFPDDTEASGPTLISSETYKTVQTWFPQLEVEEIRRRFRSNIEIGNCAAFYEDRLFTEPKEQREFNIGNIKFCGTNPCQRCSVPPRNSQNGENNNAFIEHFKTMREKSLPNWANKKQFNHFYRLATNTTIDPQYADQSIRVGQSIELPA